MRVKNNKTGKFRAVFVKWQDSTSWKRVWWSSKDIKDESARMKRDYFWTHGYLIEENKTHYIFANSIHFEDGEAVSFGSIFTIPKGCVEIMKKA